MLDPDEECIHLLTVATCVICNGRERRAAAAQAASWSYPFKARFDGQCHGCNLPITIGQLVRIDGRHIQPVRHSECV